MSPLRRILQGLRQAGAKVLTDPRAVDRWRRTLEQREKLREQAEWRELLRRMNGESDR